MQTYQKIQISNKIIMLQEMQYKEHCNIFVIDEKDECYVFDTGIGIGNLKKYLHSLGFKKIKVFISHAHFDHIGSICDFNPEEIIINQKILHNLKNEKYWAMNYMSPLDFTSHEIYEKVKAKLNIIPNFVTQLKPYNLKKIHTNNSALEIIETPGHTDDSIIINDKTNKILLTGDSLYIGQAYLNCLNSDIKKMKRTLSQIKKLEPSLILSGHNQIITGDQINQTIQKWTDNIKDIYRMS